MKKFFTGITVFLVALIAIVSSAFASLPAVTASPNEQWRVEQNQASPANTRTQLGSRLEGPLQTGATTSATTGSSIVTCGNASTNTARVSPFTKVYLKTLDSGAHGDALCLGDGYPDETLTITLVATTASQRFTVTPATKTGFASLTFTAANASATLVYSDSTNGWILQGSTPTGVTVN